MGERAFAMQRTPAERLAVHDLLERGYSDREVAERTGVPRNTVGRWRRAGPPVSIRWRPAHVRSYGYLLGLYLGDGCVTVNRRGGVMLRICPGTEYPGIIDDCVAALVLSMPECRPRVAALA